MAEGETDAAAGLPGFTYSARYVEDRSRRAGCRTRRQPVGYERTDHVRDIQAVLFHLDQADIPIGLFFDTPGDAELPPTGVVLFGGTVGQPFDPDYHAAGDTVPNIGTKALAICTAAAHAALRAISH